MKTVYLCLMALMAVKASAQLIMVRTEMGLYGTPGESFVLEHDAPAPLQNGEFLWEYTNHAFTITALANNEPEFWGNDLLAIYAFGVTPISIFDEELSKMPNDDGGEIFPVESNELGIVRFRSFPARAGDTYSIPIQHPDFAAAAVPEPSTWAGASAMALGLVSLLRRSKRRNAISRNQRS